jgi:LPS sulfotransferase NodH
MNVSSGNPFPRIFPSGAVLDVIFLKELLQSKRVYIMFVVPRSGSTWITELARNTGLLGCPQEWFNFDFCEKESINLGCPPPKVFGVHEINGYMRAFVDHSAAPNGVVGLQIDFLHAEWLCELGAAEIDWPTALSASFHLRRRDIVLQAISLYRAGASGRFHAYQNSPEILRRHAAVAYDKDAIASHLDMILANEVKLQAMLDRIGLRPRLLVYEDWVDKPAWALQAMAEALAVTGEVSAHSQEVTKLADARHDEWAARFREEAADIVAAAEAQRPPLAPR